MASGTTFRHEIYLNRVRVNSYMELLDLIEEAKEDIQDAYEYLLMLTVGKSQKLLSDEGKATMFTIRNEVKDWVDLIQEKTNKLTLLELLKEFIDENNIEDFEEFNKKHYG